MSCGSVTRMTLPSSFGFTPRSDSRIACTISFVEFLSNGVMSTIRASGMWMEANCCRGVAAP